MAEWIGQVVQVYESAGDPEVMLALHSYKATEGEDTPPSAVSAPLPRVGQNYRLVIDDTMRPF